MTTARSCKNASVTVGFQELAKLAHDTIHLRLRFVHPSADIRHHTGMANMICTMRALG
jgi:hypothetical protein